MTQSSEPINPPYPQQRTPEQHANVRRRSLPVALAGFILGIAGLVWMLYSPVTAFTPPNPYAINCSFCAMLFGVGIIFYAKGTPGTRPAVILSLLSIALGLVGPGIFARQVLVFNGLSQNLELDNVLAIATTARKYADTHDGNYPPDLLALIDAGLPTESLRSPLAFTHDPRERTDDLSRLDELRKTQSHDDLLAAIETQSDYLYLAGDLHLKPSEPLASKILIATSSRTVLRIQLAAAFADGTARYITVDEAADVLDATQQAREKLSLRPLIPPPIIQHAIDEAKAKTQPAPP